MNKGGFSWRRLVGITRAKSSISRATGIPLTKSGRQRKIGRAVTGGGCLVPIIIAGLIPLLAIMGAIAGCGPTPPVPPSEVELGGQVFIVTQGGGNYKLGLVEVKAIEETQMQSFIGQKRQAAAVEYEKYKASRDALTEQIKPLEEEFVLAERKWKRLMTNELLVTANKAEEKLNIKKAELKRLEAGLQPYYGGYWITDLPMPVQMAKTDADGNFILRIRPGRYALVADARRKVIDNTEEYQWLIWIKVRSENKDRIFLSNDNLLRTFCNDCIIRPKDIPD